MVHIITLDGCGSGAGQIQDFAKERRFTNRVRGDLEIGICLAPKARRHPQPGATPPGVVHPKQPSAESAASTRRFGVNRTYLAPA